MMPDPRIAGQAPAPQQGGQRQQQQQGRQGQDPMKQAQMEIAQMPRPELEQLAMQLIAELQKTQGGGQPQPQQGQGQPMR
jgi:hypothetical protein